MHGHMATPELKQNTSPHTAKQNFKKYIFFKSSESLNKGMTLYSLGKKLTRPFQRLISPGSKRMMDQPPFQN